MITESEDDPILPALNWRQLELLLQDDAASPVQSLMARHMLEGLRQQARFLTLGGRLREVAIIILAVTDHVNESVDIPA